MSNNVFLSLSDFFVSTTVSTASRVIFWNFFLDISQNSYLIDRQFFRFFRVSMKNFSLCWSVWLTTCSKPGPILMSLLRAGRSRERGAPRPNHAIFTPKHTWWGKKFRAKIYRAGSFEPKYIVPKVSSLKCYFVAYQNNIL